MYGPCGPPWKFIDAAPFFEAQGRKSAAHRALGIVSLTPDVPPQETCSRSGDVISDGSGGVGDGRGAIEEEVVSRGRLDKATRAYNG